MTTAKSKRARCTRESLDFGDVLLIGLLVAVISLGFDATHSDPATEAKQPTLTIMGGNPLRVAGRRFKPGEHVTVSVGPRRRATTAGVRGAFTVRFARGTCTSGTVLAVGSKGSRAAAGVPKTLCFEP
jgi:hypothetical protein